MALSPEKRYAQEAVDLLLEDVSIFDVESGDGTVERFQLTGAELEEHEDGRQALVVTLSAVDA